MANVSDQNFESIWRLPVDKGSEYVLSRAFPPSDQTIWPGAKVSADLSLQIGKMFVGAIEPEQGINQTSF
ncbi:MAG TPA: hypothetical protein VIT43_05685 [Candidatus Dormibacteraeota bacterium]